MVCVGLRERHGLGEPREEVGLLPLGQAGGLLGGRVVGSGSGTINRHFFLKQRSESIFCGED